MKYLPHLFLLLLATLPARAVEVPVTTDLQADARQAAERRVPLMLVVAADYCSFCKLLAEEFLKPMLLSGDYTDKVLIRELRIDDDDTIRDFDGAEISPDTIALRYRASLTPTLLFLDAQGREVAQRLVGVGTLDFYGEEIDQAILRALQGIRAPSRQ